MQKDITEFNTTQYDAAYPMGIEYHYWNLARNSIIKSVLKKHNLTGKKILEIGCGRGYVVESLRDDGYTCLGVDRARIESSKEYLFFGIDFDELNSTIKGETEVVLLCDVLEHIPEPEEFLARIQDAFPHVRHILITVSAREELWSNYDEYYGHMTRYSRPSLTKVLGSVGYRVLCMSYFFHLLYIPAYLLRLLRKERGIEVHPPVGILRALHRFLANVFVIEQKLLPHACGGTSLIFLIEKESTL
jgi:SAM-dependent methyltransferase